MSLSGSPHPILIADFGLAKALFLADNSSNPLNVLATSVNAEIGLIGGIPSFCLISVRADLIAGKTSFDAE
jgi:hypothetical protein